MIKVPKQFTATYTFDNFYIQGKSQDMSPLQFVVLNGASTTVLGREVSQEQVSEYIRKYFYVRNDVYVFFSERDYNLVVEDREIYINCNEELWIEFLLRANYV